jgi:hypothetical protein
VARHLTVNANAIFRPGATFPTQLLCTLIGAVKSN